jgi:hypothetical protein
LEIPIIVFLQDNKMQLSQAKYGQVVKLSSAGREYSMLSNGNIPNFGFGHVTGILSNRDDDEESGFDVGIIVSIFDSNFNEHKMFFSPHLLDVVIN